MKSQLACHKLIKSVAIEMAGSFYEDAARDNEFYRIWPNQKEFIRKQWGTFVRAARTSLAQMLKGSYPESTKETIFEALLDDRTIPNNMERGVALH